jgi:hypothetical protein
MSSKQFTAKVFRWLHQVNADCALPPNAVKVAVALIPDFNEDEGGMAWPGLQRLAARACLGKTTIIEIVRRLAACGHLRIESGKPGKGHSNRYWMVEKDPDQGELFDAAKRSDQGDLLHSTKRSDSDPPKGRISGGKRSDFEPKRSEASDQTLSIDPSKIHRGEKDSPPVVASRDEKKAGREPARTRAKARAAPAEAFERFWAAYPRKVAKEAARRAFTAAIEGGADVEAVVAGAQRYAIERQNEPERYTKYPAGWIREKRWEDPVPGGAVIDQEGNVVAVEQPPPQLQRHDPSRQRWELAEQLKREFAEREAQEVDDGYLH